MAERLEAIARHYFRVDEDTALPIGGSSTPASAEMGSSFASMTNFSQRNVLAKQHRAHVKIRGSRPWGVTAETSRNDMNNSTSSSNSSFNRCSSRSSSTSAHSSTVASPLILPPSAASASTLNQDSPLHSSKGRLALSRQNTDTPAGAAHHTKGSTLSPQQQQERLERHRSDAQRDATLSTHVSPSGCSSAARHEYWKDMKYAERMAKGDETYVLREKRGATTATSNGGAAAFDTRSGGPRERMSTITPTTASRLSSSKKAHYHKDINHTNTSSSKGGGGGAGTADASDAEGEEEDDEFFLPPLLQYASDRATLELAAATRSFQRSAEQSADTISTAAAAADGISGAGFVKRDDNGGSRNNADDIGGVQQQRQGGRSAGFSLAHSKSGEGEKADRAGLATAKDGVMRVRYEQGITLTEDAVLNSRLSAYMGMVPVVVVPQQQQQQARTPGEVDSDPQRVSTVASPISFTSGGGGGDYGDTIVSLNTASSSSSAVHTATAASFASSNRAGPTGIPPSGGMTVSTSLHYLKLANGPGVVDTTVRNVFERGESSPYLAAFLASSTAVQQALAEAEAQLFFSQSPQLAVPRASPLSSRYGAGSSIETAPYNANILLAGGGGGKANGMTSESTTTTAAAATATTAAVMHGAPYVFANYAQAPLHHASASFIRLPRRYQKGLDAIATLVVAENQQMALLDTSEPVSSSPGGGSGGQAALPSAFNAMLMDNNSMHAATGGFATAPSVFDLQSARRWDMKAESGTLFFNSHPLAPAEGVSPWLGAEPYQRECSVSLQSAGAATAAAGSSHSNMYPSPRSGMHAAGKPGMFGLPLLSASTSGAMGGAFKLSGGGGGLSASISAATAAAGAANAASAAGVPLSTVVPVLRVFNHLVQTLVRRGEREVALHVIMATSPWRFTASDSTRLMVCFNHIRSCLPSRHMTTVTLALEAWGLLHSTTPAALPMERTRIAGQLLSDALNYLRNGGTFAEFTTGLTVIRHACAWRATHYQALLEERLPGLLTAVWSVLLLLRTNRRGLMRLRELAAAALEDLFIVALEGSHFSLAQNIVAHAVNTMLLRQQENQAAYKRRQLEEHEVSETTISLSTSVPTLAQQQHHGPNTSPFSVSLSVAGDSHLPLSPPPQLHPHVFSRLETTGGAGSLSLFTGVGAAAASAPPAGSTTRRPTIAAADAGIRDNSPAPRTEAQPRQQQSSSHGQRVETARRRPKSTSMWRTLKETLKSLTGKRFTRSTSQQQQQQHQPPRAPRSFSSPPHITLPIAFFGRTGEELISTATATVTAGTSPGGTSVDVLSPVSPLLPVPHPPVQWHHLLRDGADTPSAADGIGTTSAFAAATSANLFDTSSQFVGMQHGHNNVSYPSPRSFTHHSLHSAHHKKQLLMVDGEWRWRMTDCHSAQSVPHVLRQLPLPPDADAVVLAGTLTIGAFLCAWRAVGKGRWSLSATGYCSMLEKQREAAMRGSGAATRLRTSITSMLSCPSGDNATTVPHIRSRDMTGMTGGGSGVQDSASGVMTAVPSKISVDVNSSANGGSIAISATDSVTAQVRSPHLQQHPPPPQQQRFQDDFPTLVASEAFAMEPLKLLSDDDPMTLHIRSAQCLATVATSKTRSTYATTTANSAQAPFGLGGSSVGMRSNTNVVWRSKERQQQRCEGRTAAAASSMGFTAAGTRGGEKKEEEEAEEDGATAELDPEWRSLRNECTNAYLPQYGHFVSAHLAENDRRRRLLAERDKRKKNPSPPQKEARQKRGVEQHVQPQPLHSPSSNLYSSMPLQPGSAVVAQVSSGSGQVPGAFSTEPSHLSSPTATSMSLLKAVPPTAAATGAGFGTDASSIPLSEAAVSVASHGAHVRLPPALMQKHLQQQEQQQQQQQQPDVAPLTPYLEYFLPPHIASTIARLCLQASDTSSSSSISSNNNNNDDDAGGGGGCGGTTTTTTATTTAAAAAAAGATTGLTSGDFTTVTAAATLPVPSQGTASREMCWSAETRVAAERVLPLLGQHFGSHLSLELIGTIVRVLTNHAIAWLKRRQNRRVGGDNAGDDKFCCACGPIEDSYMYSNSSGGSSDAIGGELLTACLFTSSIAAIHPNIFERVVTRQLAPVLYHALLHQSPTYARSAFPSLALLVHNLPSTPCAARLAPMVERLCQVALQAPFSVELTVSAAQICSVYTSLCEMTQQLMIRRVTDVLAVAGVASSAHQQQQQQQLAGAVGHRTNIFDLHYQEGVDRNGRHEGSNMHKDGAAVAAQRGSSSSGSSSSDPFAKDDAAAVHKKRLCFQVLRLFPIVWGGTASIFLRVCTPYFNHRDQLLRRDCVDTCVRLLLCDCFYTVLATEECFCNETGSAHRHRANCHHQHHHHYSNHGRGTRSTSAYGAPGRKIVTLTTNCHLVDNAVKGLTNARQRMSGAVDLSSPTPTQVVAASAVAAVVDPLRGTSSSAGVGTNVAPYAASMTVPSVSSHLSYMPMMIDRHSGTTHINTLKEVLHQLVEVAVCDPEPTIRLAALRSLSAETYQFLYPHEHVLNGLFVVLNDGHLSNRLEAVRILRRLAPRNPPMIYPRLRKVLLQELEDFAGGTSAQLRRRREAAAAASSSVTGGGAMATTTTSSRGARWRLPHYGDSLAAAAGGGGGGGGLQSSMYGTTLTANVFAPFMAARPLDVLERNYAMLDDRGNVQSLQQGMGLGILPSAESSVQHHRHHHYHHVGSAAVTTVGAPAGVAVGNGSANSHCLEASIDGTASGVVQPEQLCILIELTRALSHSTPLYLRQLLLLLEDVLTNTASGRDTVIHALRLLTLINDDTFKEEWRLFEPFVEIVAQQLIVRDGDVPRMLSVLSALQSLLQSSEATSYSPEKLQGIVATLHSLLYQKPSLGSAFSIATLRLLGTISSIEPLQADDIQRLPALLRKPVQQFHLPNIYTFVCSSLSYQPLRGLPASLLALLAPGPHALRAGADAAGEEHGHEAQHHHQQQQHAEELALVMRQEISRFSSLTMEIWPDVVLRVLLRTVSDYLNCTTNFTSDGLCECLQSMMNIVKDKNTIGRMEMYLPTILNVVVSLLDSGSRTLHQQQQQQHRRQNLHREHRPQQVRRTIPFSTSTAVRVLILHNLADLITLAGRAITPLYHLLQVFLQQAWSETPSVVKAMCGVLQALCKTVPDLAKEECECWLSKLLELLLFYTTVRMSKGSGKQRVVAAAAAALLAAKRHKKEPPGANTTSVSSSNAAAGVTSSTPISASVSLQASLLPSVGGGASTTGSPPPSPPPMRSVAPVAGSIPTTSSSTVFTADETMSESLGEVYAAVLSTIAAYRPFTSQTVACMVCLNLVHALRDTYGTDVALAAATAMRTAALASFSSYPPVRHPSSGVPSSSRDVSPRPEGTSSPFLLSRTTGSTRHDMDDSTLYEARIVVDLMADGGEELSADVNRTITNVLVDYMARCDLATATTSIITACLSSLERLSILHMAALYSIEAAAAAGLLYSTSPESPTVDMPLNRRGVRDGSTAAARKQHPRTWTSEERAELEKQLILYRRQFDIPCRDGEAMWCVKSPMTRTALHHTEPGAVHVVRYFPFADAFTSWESFAEMDILACVFFAVGRCRLPCVSYSVLVSEYLTRRFGEDSQVLAFFRCACSASYKASLIPATLMNLDRATMIVEMPIHVTQFRRRRSGSNHTAADRAKTKAEASEVREDDGEGEHLQQQQQQQQNGTIGDRIDASDSGVYKSKDNSVSTRQPRALHGRHISRADLGPVPWADTLLLPHDTAFFFCDEQDEDEDGSRTDNHSREAQWSYGYGTVFGDGIGSRGSSGWMYTHTSSRLMDAAAALRYREDAESSYLDSAHMLLPSFAPAAATMEDGVETHSAQGGSNDGGAMTKMRRVSTVSPGSGGQLQWRLGSGDTHNSRRCRRLQQQLHGHIDNGADPRAFASYSYLQPHYSHLDSLNSVHLHLDGWDAGTASSTANSSLCSAKQQQQQQQLLPQSSNTWIRTVTPSSANGSSTVFTVAAAVASAGAAQGAGFARSEGGTPLPLRQTTGSSSAVGGGTSTVASSLPIPAQRTPIGVTLVVDAEAYGHIQHQLQQLSAPPAGPVHLSSPLPQFVGPQAAHRQWDIDMTSGSEYSQRMMPPDGGLGSTTSSHFLCHEASDPHASTLAPLHKDVTFASEDAAVEDAMRLRNNSSSSGDAMTAAAASIGEVGRLVNARSRVVVHEEPYTLRSSAADTATKYEEGSGRNRSALHGCASPSGRPQQPPPPQQQQPASKASVLLDFFCLHKTLVQGEWRGWFEAFCVHLLEASPSSCIAACVRLVKMHKLSVAYSDILPIALLSCLVHMSLDDMTAWVRALREFYSWHRHYVPHLVASELARIGHYIRLYSRSLFPASIYSVITTYITADFAAEMAYRALNPPLAIFYIEEELVQSYTWSRVAHMMMFLDDMNEFKDRSLLLNDTLVRRFMASSLALYTGQDANSIPVGSARDALGAIDRAPVTVSAVLLELFGLNEAAAERFMEPYAAILAHDDTSIWKRWKKEKREGTSKEATAIETGDVEGLKSGESEANGLNIAVEKETRTINVQTTASGTDTCSPSSAATSQSKQRSAEKVQLKTASPHLLPIASSPSPGLPSQLSAGDLLILPEHVLGAMRCYVRMLDFECVLQLWSRVKHKPFYIDATARQNRSHNFNFGSSSNYPSLSPHSPQQQTGSSGTIPVNGTRPVTVADSPLLDQGSVDRFTEIPDLPQKSLSHMSLDRAYALGKAGPVPATIASYVGLAAEALSRWDVVQEVTNYVLRDGDHCDAAAAAAQRQTPGSSVHESPFQSPLTPGLQDLGLIGSPLYEQGRSSGTSTGFGAFSVSHDTSRAGDSHPYGDFMPHEERFAEPNAWETDGEVTEYSADQELILPLFRQLEIFRGAALVASREYDKAKLVLASVRESLRGSYAVFHTENTRVKLEQDSMFQQISDLEEGIHAIELSTLDKDGNVKSSGAEIPSGGAGGAAAAAGGATAGSGGATSLGSGGAAATGSLNGGSSGAGGTRRGGGVDSAEDVELPPGVSFADMGREVKGRIYKESTIHRLKNIACRSLPMSSTVLQRFEVIAVRSALVPPYWQLGSILVLCEHIESIGLPMRSAMTLEHFSRLHTTSLNQKAMEDYRQQLQLEKYRRLVRNLARPADLRELYGDITASLRRNIAVTSVGNREKQKQGEVEEEEDNGEGGGDVAVISLDHTLELAHSHHCRNDGEHSRFSSGRRCSRHHTGAMLSVSELGNAALTPYQVELLLLNVACRRRMQRIMDCVGRQAALQTRAVGVAPSSPGAKVGAGMGLGLQEPLSPMSSSLARRFSRSPRIVGLPQGQSPPHRTHQHSYHGSSGAAGSHRSLTFGWFGSAGGGGADGAVAGGPADDRLHSLGFFRAQTTSSSFLTGTMDDVSATATEKGVSGAGRGAAAMASGTAATAGGGGTAAAASPWWEEAASSGVADMGDGSGEMDEEQGEEDLTAETALLAEYYLLEHTISVTSYIPSVWREFGLLLFDVCLAIHNEWKLTHDTPTLHNFWQQSAKAISALQQAALLWHAGAESAEGGIGTFATASHRRRRHARSALPAAHLMLKALFLALQCEESSQYHRSKEGGEKDESGNVGGATPHTSTTAAKTHGKTKKENSTTAATSSPEGGLSPAKQAVQCQGFASLDFSAPMFRQWASIAPFLVNAAASFPPMYEALRDMCARSRYLLHQLIFHLVSTFEHPYETRFAQKRHTGMEALVASGTAAGGTTEARGVEASSPGGVAGLGTVTSMDWDSQTPLASGAPLFFSEGAARSDSHVPFMENSGRAMTSSSSLANLANTSPASFSFSTTLLPSEAAAATGGGSMSSSNLHQHPPFYRTGSHHRLQQQQQQQQQRSGTSGSVGSGAGNHLGSHHDGQGHRTQQRLHLQQQQQPQQHQEEESQKQIEIASTLLHDLAEASRYSRAVILQTMRFCHFAQAIHHRPSSVSPSVGSMDGRNHGGIKESSNSTVSGTTRVLELNLEDGFCRLPAPLWFLPTGMGSEMDAPASDEDEASYGRSSSAAAAAARGVGSNGGDAGRRGGGSASSMPRGGLRLGEPSTFQCNLKIILHVRRHPLRYCAPQFAREEILTLFLSDGSSFRLHHAVERRLTFSKYGEKGGGGHQRSYGKCNGETIVTSSTSTQPLHNHHHNNNDTWTTTAYASPLTPTIEGANPPEASTESSPDHSCHTRVPERSSSQRRRHRVRSANSAVGGQGKEDEGTLSNSTVTEDSAGVFVDVCTHTCGGGLYDVQDESSAQSAGPGGGASEAEWQQHTHCDNSSVSFKYRMNTTVSTRAASPLSASGGPHDHHHGYVMPYASMECAINFLLCHVPLSHLRSPLVLPISVQDSLTLLPDRTTRIAEGSAWYGTLPPTLRYDTALASCASAPSSLYFLQAEYESYLQRSAAAEVIQAYAAEAAYTEDGCTMSSAAAHKKGKGVDEDGAQSRNNKRMTGTFVDSRASSMFENSGLRSDGNCFPLSREDFLRGGDTEDTTDGGTTAYANSLATTTTTATVPPSEAAAEMLGTGFAGCTIKGYTSRVAFQGLLAAAFDGGSAGLLCAHIEILLRRDAEFKSRLCSRTGGGKSRGNKRHAAERIPLTEGVDPTTVTGASSSAEDPEMPYLLPRPREYLESLLAQLREVERVHTASLEELEFELQQQLQLRGAPVERDMKKEEKAATEEIKTKPNEGESGEVSASANGGGEEEGEEIKSPSLPTVSDRKRRPLLTIYVADIAVTAGGLSSTATAGAATMSMPNAGKVDEKDLASKMRQLKKRKAQLHASLKRQVRLTLLRAESTRSAGALQRAMTAEVADATHWMAARRTYSEELAEWSIAQYLFDVPRRECGSLFIDSSTGHVAMRDVGKYALQQQQPGKHADALSRCSSFAFVSNGETPHYTSTWASQLSSTDQPLQHFGYHHHHSKDVRDGGDGDEEDCSFFSPHGGGEEGIDTGAVDDDCTNAASLANNAALLPLLRSPFPNTDPSLFRFTKCLVKALPLESPYNLFQFNAAQGLYDVFDFGRDLHGITIFGVDMLVPYALRSGALVPSPPSRLPHVSAPPGAADTAWPSHGETALSAQAASNKHVPAAHHRPRHHHHERSASDNHFPANGPHSTNCREELHDTAPPSSARLLDAEAVSPPGAAASITTTTDRTQTSSLQLISSPHEGSSLPGVAAAAEKKEEGEGEGEGSAVVETLFVPEIHFGSFPPGDQQQQQHDNDSTDREHGGAGTTGGGDGAGGSQYHHSLTSLARSSSTPMLPGASCTTQPPNERLGTDTSSNQGEGGGDGEGEYVHAMEGSPHHTSTAMLSVDKEFDGEEGRFGESTVTGTDSVTQGPRRTSTVARTSYTITSPASPVEGEGGELGGAFMHSPWSPSTHQVDAHHNHHTQQQHDATPASDRRHSSSSPSLLSPQGLRSFSDGTSQGGGAAAAALSPPPPPPRCFNCASLHMKLSRDLPLMRLPGVETKTRDLVMASLRERRAEDEAVVRDICAQFCGATESERSDGVKSLSTSQTVSVSTGEATTGKDEETASGASATFVRQERTKQRRREAEESGEVLESDSAYGFVNNLIVAAIDEKNLLGTVSAPHTWLRWAPQW